MNVNRQWAKWDQSGLGSYRPSGEKAARWNGPYSPPVWTEIEEQLKMILQLIEETANQEAATAV